MASKTRLTVDSLTKLGSKKLAEILLGEASSNRQLKRELRLALLAEAGPVSVAREIRKRLAALERAHSFVEGQKLKELGSELDRLWDAIVSKVGDSDPALALELLWRFLELHIDIFERCDDSHGYIAGIFRSALEDLGSVAEEANCQPTALATVALEKVRSNHYWIYDDLITVLYPALGAEGSAALKASLYEWRETHMAERTDQDGGARTFDSTLSTISRSLREIADCEGDADAFIGTFDARDLSNRHYAVEAAIRLLAHDRPAEALDYLNNAPPPESNPAFAHVPWMDARIAALEALSRQDEAQAMRLDAFEQYLSAPHLKAYLRILPDFDDVEAEDKAQNFVEVHPSFHSALAFLVSWPAHERAARMVLVRNEELDGNLYELLDPAATALEGKFALAAVVLRRALIEYTLNKARSSRYRHAARHVEEIASLDAQIQQYGEFESHDQFMSRIKSKHPRKYGFWPLLPETS